MRRAAIAFSTLLFLCLVAASADQTLKLPYEDLGACPFECCTYGEWVVRGATELRAERSKAAAILAMVKPEVTVTAITGVVVTERAGQAIVLNPESVRRDIVDPDVEFQKSDTILLLRYQGEGAWLAWSGGKVFSLFVSQTPGSFYAGGPPAAALQVESWPETTWWVKVRTVDGQEGWTDQPDHFSGKDACS